MRRLLLGLLLIGTAGHHADAQGKWYYCDPAHAYYPYVATCPVPWRPVRPPKQQERETVPQVPVPATKAPLFAAPTLAKQPTNGPWSAATPAPVNSPSHLGPSFNCAALHTPAAQLICSSPALSRLDLAFVQAYYALRWEAGPSGWQGLKVEAVNFENAALQQCGIPLAGALPADPNPLIACLSDAEERQRSVWLSRLSGPALEEAQRPVEQHVELQRDLQSLGFLPPTATIDGVYGTATRSAIQAWQQSRELTITGFLGDNDADLLAMQADNSAQAPTQEAPSPTASEPAPPASPSAPVARSPEGQTSAVDEVPLQEEGGTFVVPVQINGAITLGFVVDSGAADVQIPLDVFTTLIRAKTIVESDLIGEQTYTLADGSTQKEPQFIVRELKVGNYIFRNVLASVSPAAGELLLGQSFLSRFAQWTLDNQQHVLRLVEKSTDSVRQIPSQPPSAQMQQPAASPATWWVLDSQSGSCETAIDAVATTHDPAFASPFMLAEEMRQRGRLDKPIQQIKDPLGSAYGIFYDGMVTAYFTTNRACEAFLRFGREKGDLP